MPIKRSRLAYSVLMLVMATACGGSEGESEGGTSEGTATSSADAQGDESEGDTQAEGESGPASESSESSDTSMPDMGGEACQIEGEPCAFEKGLSCCDELFCETPEGAEGDECVTCRPLGAECYGNDECCSGVCSSEGQSGGLLVEFCM